MCYLRKFTGYALQPSRIQRERQTVTSINMSNQMSSMLQCYSTWRTRADGQGKAYPRLEGWGGVKARGGKGRLNSRQAAHKLLMVPLKVLSPRRRRVADERDEVSTAQRPLQALLKHLAFILRRWLRRHKCTHTHTHTTLGGGEQSILEGHTRNE